MAALGRLVRLRSNASQSPLLPPPFWISHRCIAYKLFVGGLSFYTTEKNLAEAFSRYGQVIEAKIVTDRVSDRPKGFGFVTFASEDEAEKAITELNGKPLNGRVIFVDYAKPKTRNEGMPIARGPPEQNATMQETVLLGRICMTTGGESKKEQEVEMFLQRGMKPNLVVSY